ncbi:MAG: tetratricopeptide (TPR) repeat protein, partial [Myxococcota bacterium]
ADGVGTVVVLDADHPNAPSDRELKRAFADADVLRWAGNNAEEATIGRLALEYSEGTLTIVDDEEDLRFLVGPAVPVSQLSPVPDAVIGGLSVSELDDLTQLDAKGLIHTDRVVLLPDVAGTPGLTTAVLAAELGIPAGAIGRGIPIRETAQHLVRGALLDEPVADAPDDPDAQFEALAWLICEEEWSAATRLALAMPVTAAEPDEPESKDAGEAQMVEAAAEPPEMALDEGDSDEPAGEDDESVGEDDKSPSEDGESADDSEESPEDEPPVLNLGPADRRAYFLGLVAEIEGQLDVATAHYESSQEPLAKRHLATLTAIDGKTDEANARLDAIADDDAHPVSTANAAIIRWMGGNREAAIQTVMTEQRVGSSWLAACIEATLHHGETPPVPFAPAGSRLSPSNSATLYLRSGEFEEAERLLRRCLDLEPRYPQALAELTRHLIDSGRFDDAREVAEAGLAALPYFTHLRVLAGHAALGADDAAGAAAHLAEAVQQTPGIQDWHLAHLEALCRSNQKALALAELVTISPALDDRQLIDTLRKQIQNR